MSSLCEPHKNTHMRAHVHGHTVPAYHMGMETTLHVMQAQTLKV